MKVQQPTSVALKVRLMMEKFPQSSRIRKRKDFLAVYRKGKRYSGPTFTVYLLMHQQGQGRLGISVPRRVGKAVVRNRIKRLIREYFRRHPEQFEGLDVVIDVRPRPLQAPKLLAEDLEKHLNEALQRV